MAVQRQPTKAAKARTIAALIDKKNVAEALGDSTSAATYQSEIERLGS